MPILWIAYLIICALAAQVAFCDAWADKYSVWRSALVAVKAAFMWPVLVIDAVIDSRRRA